MNLDAPVLVDVPELEREILHDAISNAFKYPNTAGELDTNTTPSQSADRKEVVALTLEDHSRTASNLLPILRDLSGNFLTLERHPVLDFTESASRFAGLMPSLKPRVWEAAAAYQLSGKYDHCPDGMWH